MGSVFHELFSRQGGPVRSTAPTTTRLHEIFTITFTISSVTHTMIVCKFGVSRQPGPEVIKLFSCLSQLSMKFIFKFS